MKYRVEIPVPSAKRLKTGRLIITLESGWETYPPEVHLLCTGQTYFDFEVDDSFEYCGDTSVIDGTTFDVYVEFSNDCGSRKEKIYLTPVKGQ